jgi:hypothetical protein
MPCAIATRRTGDISMKSVRPKPSPDVMPSAFGVPATPADRVALTIYTWRHAIAKGRHMALSIKPQPRAVTEALTRDYEIVDPDDVFAFLERFPELPPLLPEIRDAIRRYFGDDRVTLSIFRDPECPEYERLHANVLLYAAPREALQLLDQFDEWWLRKRQGPDLPILVNIALQRRV